MNPIIDRLQGERITSLFALDLSQPRRTVYSGRYEKLSRNPIVVQDIALYRGIRHEGVLLFPGDAAWLYSADCPIVIAYGTQFVVVGHCGRDSLLPPHTETREQIIHESILSVMVRTLGEDVASVRVRVRVGICPKHFKHPLSGKHAKNNGRILLQARILDQTCVADREYLALERVIRAQCALLGIPPTHVKWEKECPSCDTAKHDLWSHRRWVQSGKQGPDGMNGIFVACLP